MAENILSLNRVRVMRQARGWTQAELAERAGVSRAAISAMEINRLIPSVAAALSLAASFGCKVEDLFGLTAPESVEPRWAWTPAESCRYWEARVGQQTLLIPVETTAAGTLPHDGVFREGSCCPSEVVPPPTLLLATCDPAAGLLAAEYTRTTSFRLIVLQRSSRQAISLLSQGLIHAAGVHFATPQDSDGNARMVREQFGSGFELLRMARWEEGLTLSQGTEIRTLRTALQSRLRWVGRETGSAARQCQDELLGDRPSPRHVAHDHRGVAEAIRCGWADVGLCHRFVSEEAGLRFLGVRQEDFDLCYAADTVSDPRLLALLQVVRSTAYRRMLGELPGYDTAPTGEVRHIR